MATGQLADAAANSSVGTSKIINFCCAYFALLLCAREVGDADNDEKINQQNIVSFLPARRYLARILAVVVYVCLSVCLSVHLPQVAVLLKRLNVGTHKQATR